jgi:hypothetical protein
MCPVCFSGADPVARETLNAGIGVLLGVTALVLALFARFFVALARRSKAAAHLVDHDSPSDRPVAFAEDSAAASADPDLSAVALAKADRRIA